MVERYRRGKGKQKLLGSHQRCWIWGRNVVRETLRAGKWPILELHLSNQLPPEERDAMCRLAEDAGTSCELESPEALSRRCRSSEHQGYAAKMPPYPYDDVTVVLDNRPSVPVYAILDSVQDPYNFGAMLRSAEVMGVDAVFMQSTHQVQVTSLVARTSAGAVNHLAIIRAPDLKDVLDRMRQSNITIVGAASEAEQSVVSCDLSGPVAILIGNEGRGISPTLMAMCDRLVSIPQRGQVESLNAAVAAGILFYEARRQRSDPHSQKA